MSVGVYVSLMSILSFLTPTLQTFRFYRNCPSFIEDIPKNMLVSFFRTQCTRMLLEFCRLS